MKKFSLLVLLVIASCVINSCTKESPTTPDQATVEPKGKVLLKIDGPGTPSGVESITASLTRKNYDPVSRSMNIKTDSTASLSIDSIPIGEWHLKIDAKSALGTVLYTGESNITVSEGVTVNVNLTLDPTGLGTGSIMINVKWLPLSDYTWIDNPTNPVFTLANSPSNPLSVGQVQILLDGGKYKMWYLNTYNSGKGDVGYAESTDGIHWVSKTSGAVLTPGQAGSWDDYAVGAQGVIKDNGLYRMHYCGYHSLSEPWNIGLATSQDGISWTKYPGPLLRATGDERKIGAGPVVKKDSTYFIYYNVEKTNNVTGISVATSKDGLNWTKYQGAPALVSTYSWEGLQIKCPTVIYDNTQFKMIYMNNDATAFGLAVSDDGIHWQKKRTQPIFKASDLTWCKTIAYPFLIKPGGSEYRMYYSAGNGTGEFKTGFATIKNLN